MFDAFLALILVVVIVYVGSESHASLWERTNGAVERDEKQRIALTLADYLVKEGLAFEEGERIYPNLIDTGKFEKLDAGALKNKMSLENLRVRIEAKNFVRELGENFSGVCMRRVVFVKEKGVGSIEICA